MRLGIQNTDLISMSVESGYLQFDHFHEHLELLMVLDGKLNVTVSGEAEHLDAGDCLLIHSNVKHRCCPEGTCLFLRLAISHKAMQSLLGHPVLKFWCDSVHDNVRDYGRLRQILQGMLRVVASSGKFAVLDYYSLCYQCIKVLAEDFLVYAGTGEETFADELARRRARVTDYIHENYRQHIGLDDLARELNLTSAYLSKYFKKTFGMNFLKYLNQVRIGHAIDDLLYTDHTVTEIAYENGFPNMTSFHKIFRETYGITPMSYRRQMEQEQAEATENADMTTEQMVRGKIRIYLQSGIDLVPLASGIEI